MCGNPHAEQQIHLASRRQWRPLPAATARSQDFNMPEIIYTVTATLPDPNLSEEWLAWLRGGHIADVRLGSAGNHL